MTTSDRTLALDLKQLAAGMDLVIDSDWMASGLLVLNTFAWLAFVVAIQELRGKTINDSWWSGTRLATTFPVPMLYFETALAAASGTMQRLKQRQSVHAVKFSPRGIFIESKGCDCSCVICRGLARS